MDTFLKSYTEKLSAQVRAAMTGAFVIGLLVHLPAMLSDIPNHDGLSSMYFDQNMITSGRWFLMIACGASSYFTVPWVIGLLGLLYLALAAGVLADLLQLRSVRAGILTGGLLVAFPALASTFAYVFTLDGYMCGLLLAVCAVRLTSAGKWGPLWGALCLAFSMGIYQAYLPFAIVLSIYVVLRAFGDASVSDESVGNGTGPVRVLVNHLIMGVSGFALYYVILRIFLLIQGKELDTYQGIDRLGEGAADATFLRAIPHVYTDFVKYPLSGGSLIPNAFAGIGLAMLLVAAAMTFFGRLRKGGWLKKPLFYVLFFLTLAALPPALNGILLITPSVNYHLIMRYAWVLIPLLALAYADQAGDFREKTAGILFPAVLTAGAVLIFCYGLADNIGYANLQKKYEKTYGYCLRLLDRIEQTEGYYRGMPVAIIGVVGDESYPETDLTGKVTDGMIGLNGDYLVYTGENYGSFLKNYLGATVNFLPVEEVTDIYYSPEYREMDSFPAASALRIVDGVLYVKTENKD
ncbi:MAG: glucosyltransferase domain-containing protein [Lachnospiraceae bacterium]|nr:glucosyltransferase domain-containing protein [Lachnospiraceae bacterium]